MSFYGSVIHFIETVKEGNNLFNLQIYYNGKLQKIDTFGKDNKHKNLKYDVNDEFFIKVIYLDSEFIIRDSGDYPFCMPTTTVVINNQLYNYELLFDLFNPMWSPSFADLEKFIIAIYAELVSMFDL